MHPSDVSEQAGWWSPFNADVRHGGQTPGSPCGAGSRCARWSRLANLDPMGELGRYGPQLPQNEPAQREHFKEVDEDLRRDEKADRVVKGHSPRPRWGIGYLVVLAGAAGFFTSCFVPYYGSGVFGPGSETVSLCQQGSFGSDSVGWGRLGSLLFLFGGVATVAFLAIAGVTQRGPHTAAAMLAATVVAWSLTWTGIMIREATLGLGITLEWGFWVQALSVGVVVIGTIVVVATARAGANGGDTT
jgi:hypothetical protein